MRRASFSCASDARFRGESLSTRFGKVLLEALEELSLLASGQEVLLRVPALPEFLRVARVTASGLATRLGFSLDEVDDLRLALDELCFALIGKGDDKAILELRYNLENEALIISGQTKRASVDGPLVLGDLSKQILTALVDEHKLWDGDGSGHFSLTKRQVAAQQ